MDHDEIIARERVELIGGNRIATALGYTAGRRPVDLNHSTVLNQVRAELLVSPEREAGKTPLPANDQIDGQPRSNASAMDTNSDRGSAEQIEAQPNLNQNDEERFSDQFDDDDEEFCANVARSTQAARVVAVTTSTPKVSPAAAVVVIDVDINSNSVADKRPVQNRNANANDNNNAKSQSSSVMVVDDRPPTPLEVTTQYCLDELRRISVASGFMPMDVDTQSQENMEVRVPPPPLPFAPIDFSDWDEEERMLPEEYAEYINVPKLRASRAEILEKWVHVPVPPKVPKPPPPPLITVYVPPCDPRLERFRNKNN